jgi:predicted nucleotidyltransferase
MVKKRQDALREICEKFRVSLLYAFGSQAETVRAWLEGQREEVERVSSDVDIGIKGSPGEKYSVKDKAKIALALENLFGRSRVDLVVLNEADPFLAAEIIRGERLFSRDGHEADEYELYILRRAGDLAFLERERMALILERSR